MSKQFWNKVLCCVIALLFLVMMVRYHAIYQIAFSQSHNVFILFIAILFYTLNLLSMFGLFFVKSWGFIASYFSIPISTFLFATSYFYFFSDWLPFPARAYVAVVLNALLLVAIVLLQMQRHQFERKV